MKAYWGGALIAESAATIKVEGNYYFPPQDVDADRLQGSNHRSHCRWKGEAHYYHVVVDGRCNDNAAWYYPEPKAAANNLKGYIGFWNGVEIKH